ncbi:MAG: OmpA family protein [Bacteroidetes bacterium]|nr:OmpA family protein [Bacteroidota bacterium]
MKRLRYSFLLFLWVSFGAMAQKITTLSPYVEEQSQPEVILTKVELTDDYTILHFRFEFAQRNPTLRDFFGERQGNLDRNTIEVDPKTRLYEPKNTTKKFKFIKAVGIPVAPETRTVYPGDVVKFSVYYERLDPGIEVFDMFEGKDYGTKRYWNYFGVHIRNPRRVPPKPKPEPKKEEPPVIANTPTPVPPIESKPEAPVLKVVTLRGTVIDAKTKKPIAAKISYVVPSEDNGLDSMQLSASSGKFKISLDAGNKYAYVAAAKGYFPASGAFDLTQAKVGEEVASEIVLNPVAVGESITLNNIYFDTGKYDLLPASSSELDRLVQLMRENVNMEIRVEGHTDNLGDFDKNVELSQNRANAVKKYLVAKGIDSARVGAKGLGSTRPVSKGTSEAERRRNRRVEFIVEKL